VGENLRPDQGKKNALDQEWSDSFLIWCTPPVYEGIKKGRVICSCLTIPILRNITVPLSSANSCQSSQPCAEEESLYFRAAHRR
jgi:hypothetical protein